MALTVWTFVGKVMSLPFNPLSRLVIAFLPRSKHFFFSALRCPIVLETFLETIIFPPLRCLCTFVKDQPVILL